MNAVYVRLAGCLPEQPCLKALSVLSSRCMLRPPVCLPGWPTLAPTICAALNTFCHCHTARRVYWWSLSDSPSLSLCVFLSFFHGWILQIVKQPEKAVAIALFDVAICFPNYEENASFAIIIFCVPSFNERADSFALSGFLGRQNCTYIRMHGALLH